MSRPLRIEFPDAVYHVTSRGDRREPIYRDDADRRLHLEVLAQAADRFDAQVLAYCLMGNHYHLVLQTRQANLSRLMRHLNGVYTQAFNRCHSMVGHLFQGRFKALLVDRDAYLLALCRYVERNPVAAGLVAKPGLWRMSAQSIQPKLQNRALTTRKQRFLTAVHRLAKTVPRLQRTSALTWPECLKRREGDLSRALALAYREGGLTMTALANVG